jgi:hypothetical protein
VSELRTVSVAGNRSYVGADNACYGYVYTGSSSTRSPYYVSSGLDKCFCWDLLDLNILFVAPLVPYMLLRYAPIVDLAYGPYNYYGKNPRSFKLLRKKGEHPVLRPRLVRSLSNGSNDPITNSVGS